MLKTPRLLNIGMSTKQEGISIISGTDRVESNSALVARAYAGLLQERGIAHDLMLLCDLPRDLDRLGTYGEPGEGLQPLVERHIAPYQKFVFVIPEYNGSFPGILKLFVDLVEPKHFHGKKAALVGISDGHAGNLRGLDQFAAVLNYLRVNVLWQKPKLSKIQERLSATGEMVDPIGMGQLREQVDRLLEF